MACTLYINSDFGYQFIGKFKSRQAAEKWFEIYSLSAVSHSKFHLSPVYVETGRTPR